MLDDFHATNYADGHRAFAWEEGGRKRIPLAHRLGKHSGNAFDEHAEGDRGTLTHQGTRYKGFDRR